LDPADLMIFAWLRERLSPIKVTHHAINDRFMTALDTLVVTTAVTGLAIGTSLTAWGRWLVFARVWLPLTGRLPWSVAGFLDDGCRRGVLRQVGAVYQFRHARLQTHLTDIG